MPRERDTFESLVYSYAGDLYRFGYGLCRQQQLAEDLVQETFLRAWKALPSLRSPAAAQSWLFTILRREFYRTLTRSGKDEQTISLDDMDTLPETLVSFPTEYSNDQVDEILKGLPLSYREPLLLQVLGGYTCDEIATIMQISSAAVMTRLCRARQQLRHLLDIRKSGANDL